MRSRILIVTMFLLAVTASGCRRSGIIAEGGDFHLTVEQLRFEVTRLGPSARFDDTFEGRRALVLNLASRSYLAAEAERRGYGGENLDEMVANAEKTAVAEEYVRWKIENAVMLPRIKTKPWIAKLDRMLHLKDLTFMVHPVAEEALNDLRSGVPFTRIEESAAEREDIQVVDMGWLAWKDLSREVANIVFRLDVGAASDLFPANDGYHIFYLEETRPLEGSEELLSARSKRFVRAMEEERLARDLREELKGRYDVRFREDGLSRGLMTFAIAFSGERPPDTLMTGVILEYPEGRVTVGDIYSMFFALPEANRPYLGDYQGLKDFSLEMIMPELKAMAGYEMGLDRSRRVQFAVRKAREDGLMVLMEDYFKSQVEITQQDIEQYYEERKGDLYEPGSYHGARILVNSMEDARQAHRQIMMGGDFADVAMQVSEDERSAPYGGDFGWINDGLVAVYDSVLADMNPGDVSRPFKTYSGFEIIRLLERADRRYLTLEEAAPHIRVFTTETRTNEMLDDLVSRKREETGFFMNEDLLRRVPLPEPEYAPRQSQEELPEVEEGPDPLPKIG